MRRKLDAAQAERRRLDGQDRHRAEAAEDSVYVFGAQAVIAAGAVRSTADIDITVEDIEPKALLRALRSAGFVLRSDVDDVETIVDALRVLPLEHRTSGFQLGVMRAGPGLEKLMLASSWPN